MESPEELVAPVVAVMNSLARLADLPVLEEVELQPVALMSVVVVSSKVQVLVVDRRHHDCP